MLHSKAYQSQEFSLENKYKKRGKGEQKGGTYQPGIKKEKGMSEAKNHP